MSDKTTKTGRSKSAADDVTNSDDTDTTPEYEPLSAAATIAPATDAPDDPAPKTDAEIAAERHVQAEADAAEQAEQAKQQRAQAGVTGSPNGDVAGTAYGDRIAAAKFEHRNQGHDDTMSLLDEMLAAIQRLEAKLMGQA